MKGPSFRNPKWRCRRDQCEPCRSWGSIMPSSSLHSVDLPAALGPMIASDCPAGRRKDIPLMMWRPLAAKIRFSVESSPTGSGKSIDGEYWENPASPLGVCMHHRLQRLFVCRHSLIDRCKRAAHDDGRGDHNAPAVD